MIISSEPRYLHRITITIIVRRQPQLSNQDNQQMQEKKSNQNQTIKDKTMQLYLQLPQVKVERIKRIDIRDKIIELNYSFFGYVASHTFINNPSVTYEDKFQSALMHFCECWWWYQWDGDETHKAYRKDLSFSSFYRQRVGEMIERELNEVKYSIRRSLCMEVGNQLGKHWGKVSYDDLSQVTLPPEKMNSLKAIFGTLYWADLETHELYIESDERFSTFEYPNKTCTTVTDVLIKEMCDNESKLSDNDLVRIASKYNLDFWDLKKSLSDAEYILYKKLTDSISSMNLD